MEMLEHVAESETTEVAARPSVDLAVCPKEILALDPNAAVLWVKFLQRTGIPMSAKATKGKNLGKDLWVDNNCRRAAIIRGFGIAGLTQRLAAATDEISRARVWWRESAACAEGDTVPDLSAANMCVLNPFIITKELKFEDNRFKTLKPESEPEALQMDDAARARNTRKRIEKAQAGRDAAKAALEAKSALKAA